MLIMINLAIFYRGEGSVTNQEETALYHLVAQSTSGAPPPPPWLAPPLVPAWPTIHCLFTIPAFHGEHISVYSEMLHCPTRTILKGPRHDLVGFQDTIVSFMTYGMYKYY